MERGEVKVKWIALKRREEKTRQDKTRQDKTRQERRRGGTKTRKSHLKAPDECGSLCAGQPAAVPL